MGRGRIDEDKNDDDGPDRVLPLGSNGCVVTRAIGGG